MSGSGGVSVRAGRSPNLRSKRADLRRAQRRMQVRLSRDTDDPETPGLACALICARCGWMTWPREHAGAHPHRHDPQALVPRDSCEHCGDDSWIDLSRDSTALALRVGQDEQSEAERVGRKQVVTQTSLGLFTGGLVGVITAGLAWPAALMAACGAALGGLVAQRHRTRAAPEVFDLPGRWSMTLPPNDPPQRTLNGPARGEGEFLHAPISGRVCLAYEVGLRRDAQADAPLASWTLLEQRTTALSVDGQRVGDAPHLRLQRQALGEADRAATTDAAIDFLRRRGMLAVGSSDLVFETIVQDGDTVQLHRTATGDILQTS